MRGCCGGCDDEDLGPHWCARVHNIVDGDRIRRLRITASEPVYDITHFDVLFR